MDAMQRPVGCGQSPTVVRYLGQVVPSEFGVRRPPWFLFLPSYWRPGVEEATAPAGNEQADQVTPADYPKEAPDYAVSGPARPNDLTVRRLDATEGAGEAKKRETQAKAMANRAGERMDPPSPSNTSNAACLPRRRCHSSPRLRQIFGRPTVEVKALSKTFGSFRAVDHMSLELFEGQIYSLLGHNGAGTRPSEC